MATDGLDASATYSYDPQQRLESWTRTATGVDRHFRYDWLGNLVGRDLASPTDPDNQIFDHPTKQHALMTSNFAGKTYQYDPDGNMSRRGSQYLWWNSDNTINCIGTAFLACDLLVVRYDEEGNRVYEGDGSAQRHLVGDLFEWDASTNTATAHVLAFGRRIATRVSTDADLRTAWVSPWWRLPFPPEVLGWGFLGGGSLAFLVLLARLGALAALRSRPAPASLSLGLCAALVIPHPAMAGGGGGGNNYTTRWLFHDHLGSATLVTNDAGDEIHRRVFEPFGQVIAETSSPTESSAQLFTGQRYEESAEVYDFRARLYDAESGRFLSVDPVMQDLADPQMLNAYSYVRNNPINFVDPSGAIISPRFSLASRIAFEFQFLGTSELLFDPVKKRGELILHRVGGAMALVMGSSLIGTFEFDETLKQIDRFLNSVTFSFGRPSRASEGDAGVRGAPVSQSPEIDQFVSDQQRIIDQLTRDRDELQELVAADEAEAAKLREEAAEIHEFLSMKGEGLSRRGLARGAGSFGPEFIRDQTERLGKLGNEYRRLEARAAANRTEIATIDRRIGWHRSQIRWAEGGFRGPRPPRP